MVFQDEVQVCEPLKRCIYLMASCTGCFYTEVDKFSKNKWRSKTQIALSHVKLLIISGGKEKRKCFVFCGNHCGLNWSLAKLFGHRDFDDRPEEYCGRVLRNSSKHIVLGGRSRSHVWQKLPQTAAFDLNPKCLSVHSMARGQAEGTGQNGAVVKVWST